MTTNAITPNWPAPTHVKAFTTLRNSGVGERESENKAFGHDNIKRLQEHYALPSTPILLNQTHSTNVVPAKTENINCEADALFTSETNLICTILTADCLPVLVTNINGSKVAAIHAGWRGLVNGIVENTLSRLAIPPKETLIWLGPAISADHFEVRDDVYKAFTAKDPEATKAFVPINSNQWLANLYTLAKQRLNKLGIEHIFGGDLCTFCDSERFYSYRRDGKLTGRIATSIWLAA